MADIDALKVCKSCKNVYSMVAGGVRSSSTKCPVCGSTNRESVYSD